MLVDGKKFDLRLYVLVTSASPLRAYLAGEGLGRLATLDYARVGPANLAARCMHLTNYRCKSRHLWHHQMCTCAMGQSPARPAALSRPSARFLSDRGVLGPAWRGRRGPWLGPWLAGSFAGRGGSGWASLVRVLSRASLEPL